MIFFYIKEEFDTKPAKSKKGRKHDDSDSEVETSQKPAMNDDEESQASGTEFHHFPIHDIF